MELKEFSRGKNRESTVSENDNKQDVRISNIIAAISVADCVRTSLGPRGMDKMILQPKNEVVISNDGATILKKLEVSHPTAKMVLKT
jgi:T-complex protein 1 subunit delta